MAPSPEIVEVDIMAVFEPKSTPSENPSDFETTIPSSTLLRQSLIVFEQSYPQTYSDNNVLSVAGSKSMLAVLKTNQIEFTMPTCNALVTDVGFNNVSVTGFIAMISSTSRVELYSAYDCVRFAEYDRLLQGDVFYINGYIVETEGEKLAVREPNTAVIMFNGVVGGAVEAAGMIGGELVAVLQNGYIMSYNESVRAFTIKGEFPVEFAELKYADNTFYGITKDGGNFFTIDDVDTKHYPLTSCRLSENAPYAICGTTLVGKGGDVHDNVDIKGEFTVGVGMVAANNGGNLNMYKLKREWQRVVQFSYELPTPCVADGAVYYKGFSGDVFRYAEGRESRVSDMPISCNTNGARLSLGRLLCEGNECGTFGEIVLENAETRMMKRQEGGKVYYWFEGK